MVSIEGKLSSSRESFRQGDDDDISQIDNNKIPPHTHKLRIIIPFTSRQCQNNENKWKVIKKLSYHRDSAGRRPLRCLGSFKVTDFCTNQLRSQRPNKADDRAGSKTLFLLHSQTYETHNLKFHLIFFTIFANLPPPSKCRLVRPAPPAPFSLRLWSIILSFYKQRNQIRG